MRDRRLSERPKAEGLMGKRPEVEGPRLKVEQLTVAILEQIGVCDRL